MEELLQFLYLMPVAVIRLGRAGRIELLNPKAAQLLHTLNIVAAGNDGAAILDALSPGLGQQWAGTADRIGTVVQARRISPSGPGLPIMHLQLQVVRPDTRSTMIVIEDLTLAVEQERDALRQKLRLGLVLENIHGYCAIMLNESGTVSEWNPSIERLFGASEAEIAGRPLLSRLSDAAGLLPSAPDFAGIERAVALQGWCRLVAPWIGRDGQVVWGDCVISPVIEKSGFTCGFVAVIRDVTEEQARNQALSDAALLDPLTGVCNRRGFDHGVASWLARAPHAAGVSCVVLVDIDHFKKVNDTFGHEAGDRVLRAVALALKSAARGADLLARFGGEEFVLFLPDTTEVAAASIAERLRAKLEAIAVDTQGGPVQVTASFGVAQQGLGEPLTAVMARADAALYRAKQAGRNCVTVSSQGT